MPDPRKCETPGCDAAPCPPRRDPDGIDQAHKKRPAWIWECECGWKCVRPTLELTPGEQRLSAGAHLDDVALQTIGPGEVKSP